MIEPLLTPIAYPPHGFTLKLTKKFRGNKFSRAAELASCAYIQGLGDKEGGFFLHTIHFVTLIYPVATSSWMC